MKNEIGSQYDGRVAFYLVGTDPREGIEELKADKERNGYPWPVAYADEGMIDSLRVFAQPFKIALSSDGRITHRHGVSYDTDRYESWGAFFDDISAN